MDCEVSAAGQTSLVPDSPRAELPACHPVLALLACASQIQLHLWDMKESPGEGDFPKIVEGRRRN